MAEKNKTSLDKSKELLPQSGHHFKAIDTASDVNLSDNPPRELFVGGGGDLVVTDGVGGQQVTFSNVAPGYHPLSPAIIHSTATGTTATGIVAIW